MPSTAVGHVALNTGTFATYHGVMGNSWHDGDLQKIAFDTAPASTAAVFSPSGFYDYGKSAHNIMVDGISDQLILASRPNAPIGVYSFSYKSRAAIGCAGSLGKAIWFDSKAGRFTSSKAYFEKLPDWLDTFNKKHPIDPLLREKWLPCFPQKSGAYSMVEATSSFLQKVVNGIGEACYNLATNHEAPYESFIRVPLANNLLLDLAQEFLTQRLSACKNEQLVLWISLSPLDKLCHFYGPHGKEPIDMIYHLDQKLKRFFQFVYSMFDPSDVLFVLTADHGVDPIPEDLHNKGYKNARRILIPTLSNKIESHIRKKHGITIECTIKTPQVYLDKTFDTLDKEKQKIILNDIKTFLEQQEGIKKAWTYEELTQKDFSRDQIEFYYKNQQFPGRSGPITFQVFPFVLMTKHPAGVAHRTPYEWNTHIPLILYQKGTLEHKVIKERVWATQFANSLAQIHKVPKPSASTEKLLPGLFTNN